jgi:hypothetical protein
MAHLRPSSRGSLASGRLPLRGGRQQPSVLAIRTGFSEADGAGGLDDRAGRQREGLSPKQLDRG